MKAWIRDLWGALSFRTPVYDGLRRRSDAFYLGFVLVVIVALLAGLPGLVTDAVGSRQPAEPAAEPTAADISAAVDRLMPYLERLGVPGSLREQIKSMAESSLPMLSSIASGVSALPTRLPQPAGRALSAVGSWASQPFADGVLPLGAANLGTWLGYGIWVMLAARLLGGRATLHGFFGLTSLFAVPHLLDIFGSVAILGPALGFIAFVWGAAVYVKATAVSQELSFERALLAVLLPALAAAMLFIIALSAVAGAIAFVALGAR